MSQNPIPTPDFESYSMACPVITAAITPETIQVTWADGLESEFHFLWLRDNCACAECIDAGSHERVYSILDIPADLGAQLASVSEQGGLQITWSDGHQSHYHPGWLRHFDYANGSRPVEQWPLQSWDRTLEQTLPLFVADAVLHDEDSQYDFLCAIRRLGLAIVTGVPKDGATFERLSSKAGLLRDMNWGKIFEIITSPEGEYVANRNHPLDAHSDAATREYMPGLQIFQCVENNSEGGESFWVDGLHIAERLRAHHPEAWDLLSTVPWEQANRSAGTHYRWNAPIFEVDRQGNLIAVRDTTWLREPLRVDVALTPRLYAAYRLYAQLKAERSNQVERKLVEGDVAFVNNRRVLHGRRGFNAASGLRHIRTCYGELEELHSSIRMIERRRQVRYSR
jgi:gamma-butyrobetaine dioxygenase